MFINNIPAWREKLRQLEQISALSKNPLCEINICTMKDLQLERDAWNSSLHNELVDKSDTRWRYLREVLSSEGSDIRELARALVLDGETLLNRYAVAIKYRDLHMSRRRQRVNLTTGIVELRRKDSKSSKGLTTWFSPSVWTMAKNSPSISRRNVLRYFSLRDGTVTDTANIPVQKHWRMFWRRINKLQSAAV